MKKIKKYKICNYSWSTPQYILDIRKNELKKLSIAPEPNQPNIGFRVTYIKN